jgi:hypothetical protein
MCLSMHVVTYAHTARRGLGRLREPLRAHALLDAVGGACVCDVMCCVSDV